MAPGRPVRPSMAWPPPLPGRVAWSWLLGTPLRGLRTGRLLRLLDGRIPEAVLIADIGAGPGFVSAALARRPGPAVRRFVLMDPQRQMWTTRRHRRVRASLPDAVFVVADATDLPLRDASVDVALSLGVLCCLRDSAVPAAIAETARIVKPGGWLLFAVPARRGVADEERWSRAGFRPIVSLRPGRTLLQKAH